MRKAVLRWKQCIFTLAIHTLILTQAFAQLPPRTKSDADSNESLIEKVDRLFSHLDKSGSPGCALAVIKAGQIVYKRGYGRANLDYDIPISSKTVFYIASGAKPFTAISLAILAKEGKLSLDDDIRKYLPEMPEYQTPIIIRNLIYHTSGIREYEHLIELAGVWLTDARDEEVFKVITQQKELNFKPGTEYLYSNSGYFLLAQIVRRVSGKSLGEFAAENIFKPLGMMNTRFYNDNTVVIKNRATGYSRGGDGGFSVELARFNQVGPGGLFTTIEDLFLWDQNFYQNKLAGGGADLIQQVLTPAVVSGGEVLDYAFGIEVEQYKGLNMFSQGGASFGFNADLVRFPEQRFSVICLCNLSNIESGRLTRQVADLYLSNQFSQNEENSPASKPEIVKVPESELNAVAGLYFNAANNNLRRLYVKDGKLMYSRGSSESELAPLSGNRFLMLGVPDRVEITFKSLRSSAPFQMFTSVNGGKPLVHERVESATYTSPQLAQFTGSYYSQDIDARYTVVLRDSKLFLQRKNVDDTELQPRFADTFSAIGTGTLNFTRDRKNRISGFLLSTGRVRRLRFNKL